LNKLNNYLAAKYSTLKFIEEPIVSIYTSFEDEVKVLKYGVGIHNKSYTNIAKLNGKDVCALLQRISTNDIDKLENFHYLNTLFLNEKGGLIDRTTLVKFEDDCYLVGSYDKVFRLQRWIERYILNEDIGIENISGEFLLLQVLGPQAESYLTLICGKEVDELDNNKLHRVDIEGLKFHLLKKETLTGEKIYWIIGDIIDAVTIIDFMLTHTSVFDLAMIGEKALQSYRIDEVIPAFPNEINDKYNPIEAGLMKEVSTTKENFIGYEVIHEFKISKEVERKLKKATIIGEFKNDLPFKLFDKTNNYIGTITSAVKTEEKNKYHCLCYIESKFLENNDVIEINYDGSNEVLKLKIKN